MAFLWFYGVGVGGGLRAAPLAQRSPLPAPSCFMPQTRGVFPIFLATLTAGDPSWGAAQVTLVGCLDPSLRPMSLGPCVRVVCVLAASSPVALSNE